MSWIIEDPKKKKIIYFRSLIEASKYFNLPHHLLYNTYRKNYKRPFSNKYNYDFNSLIVKQTYEYNLPYHYKTKEVFL